jgi:hypothetical protein
MDELEDRFSRWFMARTWRGRVVRSACMRGVFVDRVGVGYSSIVSALCRQTKATKGHVHLVCNPEWSPLN